MSLVIAHSISKEVWVCCHFTTSRAWQNHVCPHCLGRNVASAFPGVYSRHFVASASGVVQAWAHTGLGLGTLLASRILKGVPPWDHLLRKKRGGGRDTCNIVVL